MSNEKDKQHLQELAAYRFTVDNLRERVADLEKDAARYRLRLETIRALYPSAPSDIELDTAIDAALAAQAKQGGA